MQQYSNVVQDLQGNAVSTAVVRVLDSAGQTLVQIYDSNYNAIANPIPVDDQGGFQFSAPNGKYLAQVEVGNRVYKKIGPITLFDEVDASNLVRKDTLRSEVGAAMTGWHGSTGRTVEQQLDMLALEKANICDPKYAGGADPTGARDSAAAVNAAWASLNGNNGGVVHGPSGTYTMSTSIVGRLRVSMYGAGGSSTVFNFANCNGINYAGNGFSQDNAYLEDFGMTGTAGANFDALYCPAGTGVKYGLHITRVSVSDFNRGFVLLNNLYCSISFCRMEYINTPITLGNRSTLTQVFKNTLICSSGNSHGGTAEKVGFELLGGEDCEAIKVTDNFAYGFDIGMRIATITDLLVSGNGLDACMVYGIHLTAPQHACNIQFNFIEMLGPRAIAGIFGAPVGSGEFLSKINIDRNTLTVMNIAATSVSGIIINTPTDTFQWHVSVTHNILSSFTLHDIRMNLPGKSNVEHNRCLSNVNISIWVGAVRKPPVYITKNECKGAIYYDVPDDVATGKIIRDQNIINDTFVPYQGTFAPKYIPQSGAFGTIVYGRNVGQWQRIGDMIFGSGELYTTAAPAGTAAGLLFIDISGIPHPPRATLSPACFLGDVRLWAAGKGPFSAAVQLSGQRIALFTRATSTGDTAPLNAADLTATDTANLISFSFQYLVAI